MKKVIGFLLMMIITTSSVFASKVYLVFDKAGSLQSLSLEKVKNSIEADFRYNANTQSWSMTIAKEQVVTPPSSITIKDNMLLPPALLQENGLRGGGLAKGIYKSTSPSALNIVVNLICWKCSNS